MDLKKKKKKKRKRPFALKATAAKGVKQLQGLKTYSQSNLKKPDRMKNEAMRVVLGTTNDRSIEAIECPLDLPPMKTRHEVDHVKAHLNDLLDLCLLIPSGTKGRNSNPPANSILAGPP